MKILKNGFFALVIIVIGVAMVFYLPNHAGGGDMNPPGPPGSTMKSLDEIPPTWSQILPASERFVLLEIPCTPPPTCPFPPDTWAVLDKETGLVWEKSPEITDKFNWDTAVFHCYNREVANRRGWRLPEVEELTSLVDTRNSPTLPAGHPFGEIPAYAFWAITPSEGGTNQYYYRVDFSSGSAYSADKNFEVYVWCVRGGGD